MIHDVRLFTFIYIYFLDLFFDLFFDFRFVVFRSLDERLFFQRHSFVCYWLKMIFWSEKVDYRYSYGIFVFMYHFKCLNTFQVNIVIVVLLLLGRQCIQVAIMLSLTLITKHYMFKTQFKLDIRTGEIIRCIFFSRGYRLSSTRTP